MMNQAGVILCTVVGIGLSGCRSTGSGPDVPSNDLDALPTARLMIGAQAFEVWVANTPATRERGLMFVGSDQMEPLSDGTERGMLFVFDQEQNLSFWMKDTIIPLDIAYADNDGRIINTLTMTPLDRGTYPSAAPARFALEVNAGLFSRLGIKSGDPIAIPGDLLTP